MLYVCALVLISSSAGPCIISRQYWLQKDVFYQFLSLIMIMNTFLVIIFITANWGVIQYKDVLPA